MLEDILSLGNKIEMQEIDTSMNAAKSHENKRVYVSQILEFDENEDNLISIAMPIYEGKLIPLEVDKRFDMYFYTAKGIYSGQAVIENRYKSNNIYILLVRVTSQLKKFQRRQFFRLDTNVEIRYKEFSADDEKYYRLMGKISDSMNEKAFSAGISLDISGGGARFVSKDNLQKDSNILVQMTLPMDNKVCKLDSVAKVIASIPARNKNNVYENRIEFVQIKDDEREQLIKYIFWEERNRRKKQFE